MTDYNIEAFAELDAFAQKMTTQNEAYAEAGINNPKFAYIHKNKIAEEQADHKEIIAAVADELPYEQLGVEYGATEIELETAVRQLETVEQAYCTAKMAVDALAGSLMAECYPAQEPIIDERRLVRHDAISQQSREELELRVSNLSDKLGQLAAVYEVAGEAWPIPLAAYVEPPAAEETRPEPPRVLHVVSEPEVTAEEDEFPTELEQNGHPDFTLVRQNGEHHVDQPNASKMIVEYLINHAGSIVTAEEVAEVLYGHCEYEGEDLTKLRHRVVVRLAPGTHGKHIAQLLEEEGDYKLQYGWRKYMTTRPDGRVVQLKRKVRVYRLTNGAGDVANPAEFNEKVFTDEPLEDIKEREAA